MEYNLSGKVSLDDYIQANKFQHKQGFWGIFRFILYPALLIYLAFPFFRDMEVVISIFKTSPFTFMKILSPLVLWIVLLIIFNKIMLPFMWKRRYNANKLLQLFQNIKINEQCISITTEAFNNNLTKSNIHKIKYDKDAIYIYSGLHMGFVIKKRFLENENDFDELVSFVKTNYEKR
ncbi:MAG: YcxB family protein [Spirochaetaceae bacterium]|jgi:hypothetical protein|nr:YcxB family protein [Spirochaetaceae bacterium]